MLTYRHPQGSTIVVHDNGTMTVTDKNGKPKKTSATPEKLAAGHGGWTLVANAASPPPEMPAAPPGGATRAPMRFKQADQATVLAAVTNDDWWMQQKLDGVRAQLVISPGEVWARATSGGPLKSTVAGPVAAKVISRFPVPSTTPETPAFETVVLDGEILDGEWWMFDLTTDTSRDHTPYEDRLAALDHVGGLVPIKGSCLSPLLRVLPTAKTTEEKAALLELVIKGAGEGVLIKRRDSGYYHDARVEHSLKFKITHTVDVVVTARDTKGRDKNATLALWSEGRLIEVGSTSMIGKPVAQVGDVMEVRYLYAGAGGRLVQPTVLQMRPDKAGADCTIDQLRFADKTVLTNFNHQENS